MRKFIGLSIKYVRKIFRKTNKKRTCAYQGVRNISFSETADLVTFTEEILNGKLHFLYNEIRIKFYNLFTHDGLVLTVEAYGGQGFDDEHKLGRIAAIVLKLMKVYHMFTEKCYNSVVSTEFLSEKNTFVTGTLRKDQKGNPKEVTGGKHKKERCDGLKSEKRCCHL